MPVLLGVGNSTRDKLTWYWLVLSKYAQFSGRATRAEYWFFMAIAIPAYVDYVARAKQPVVQQGLAI